ncbi:MAG: beta-lactamase family protein [Alphaproteobacteria bacterium]|nr:beta-lactamase family protein [Alphaproteobacteria bacterium]
MKRIALALLALILVAALAAAGWYYRPWSPYSPASIAALDVPEDYPQTFQRMDEILPWAAIETYQVDPFPRADGSLPQTYEFEGETRELEDFITRSQMLGMTVLVDREIVAQEFRHGADAGTRFTSWSVAKSFVATLIGKALQDGLIESLDDTAETYAPQFAGTDYGATSLRHLLMMSAGMDFNEEYSPEAPSDVRPLFFNAFILRRDVDQMVGEIARNREPGQDQHYTSPNSHVLAAVARAVYGGSLAEVMSEQLWTPLGMTRRATWLQNTPGEDGIAIGYCCLQANSEDYARLGQLYLQDGVWDGERLLPEGWVDQATIPNAPFQEPGATPYPGRGYALHFWVPEGYDGEFYAAGVFGQYVWVDRNRGVVIAWNSGDADWASKNAEQTAVFRAIAEHVSPRAERLARFLQGVEAAIMERQGAGLVPDDTEEDAGSDTEPGR